MPHNLPIIQDPSEGKDMSKRTVDGLIDMAIVNPNQHRMIEGLIVDVSKGDKKDSMEPIVARGSAVGAPTMMPGSRPGVYNPKTKRPAGMLLPVGQN